MRVQFIKHKRDRKGRTTTYLLFFLIACFSLSGCGATEGMFDSWSIFGFGGEKKEQIDPAGKLIVQAMDEYKVGKYSTAMDHFQEIKDHYPFSPEALLAELKLADCK